MSVPEIPFMVDLPTPEAPSFGGAGFRSTRIQMEEEAGDFARTVGHVQDINQKSAAQLEKELWAAYRSALQEGHVYSNSLQHETTFSRRSAKPVAEESSQFSPVHCLPDVSLPGARTRPDHPIKEAATEDDIAAHRPAAPPPEKSDDASPLAHESLVHVIPGQLLFLVVQSFKDPRLSATRKQFQYVTSMAHCSYDRSHSGFEPVSIAHVVKFCHFLSAKVNREASGGNPQPVVYLCKPKYKHCSSATFLIAAYLVLELGYSVEDAVQPFQVLGEDLLRPFQGVSCQDCLRGLLKARNNLWLKQLDVGQYDSLMEPARGVITHVCPKFVAFKGPDAASEQDCALQLRATAKALHEMNVQVVVRLNDAESYDTSAFSKLGITHVDLSYEGYAWPQQSVVTKFLDICDAHTGAVAVHCGMGGQGTLVALWMMRNEEFSAGEAMGFVRVMRPGCVVGKQQKLLQQLDGATWIGNAPAKLEHASSFLSKTHSDNSPTTESSSSRSSSSSTLIASSERETPASAMFRQHSQRSILSAEGVIDEGGMYGEGVTVI